MTTPLPPASAPALWLGGQIDVRFELDLGPGEGFAGLWDSGIWGEDLWGSDDPAWTDVTEYVLEISGSYGLTRWGERAETGTFQVLVRNEEGYFTPNSTAVPPWFRSLRLGRRGRYVAIPDPDFPLVKVPLQTGRLDAIYDHVENGGYDVTATLQFTDFMGVWARSNPLAGTATGVQTTDERVNAALDKMGWPALERDIDAGSHSMATSDLAQTTLEEVQRAADAEGSIMFASPDGLATFKNKDWLIAASRSINIQGYVGYDPAPTGEQAAHAISFEHSNELARVANEVHFAREGGTVQSVSDAASILATDGPITYQRSDLHNSGDTEVLALAVRYLAAFKDPRLRIDSVTIAAVEDTGNADLNRLLWDTQLGDLLAVLVEPAYGWEIEREVHVMGISHTITGDDWLATFRLDDAQVDEETFWILQDPVFGVLGETTRLA